MSVLLNINKHYNFSVFANAILGTSFRNTKLISILDYKTALKFGNIELLQKKIYPYLPPDTLIDHTKYTYYLFEVSDKTIVLADQWIVSDSIEETVGLNFTLSLNNVTTSQVNLVSNQLRLLGISFSIL